MSDNTRQRLIETAGPIFAHKGYDGTTVRDICVQAEANQAAINYHFGDKENFYVQTVRHAAETCCNRSPIPTWPPGTPARQKLSDFIEMFLRRVAVDYDPAWHAQLIILEMVQPTRACEEFVRDFATPVFLALAEILQELAPHLPPQQLKFIGFSILGQCLHYRFARPVIALMVGAEEFRSYDVPTLRDHIAEFSLAGIDRLAQSALGRSACPTEEGIL